MNIVGQIERRTQALVVALFRNRLGYDYLGDRITSTFAILRRNCYAFGVKPFSVAQLEQAFPAQNGSRKGNIP